MASDEIPNGAASAPKKKRNNRSAKLKQCKLDARREQWLSQVKGACSISPPPISPSMARLPRPRNCEIDSKSSHEHERDDERLRENDDLDSQTQSVSTDGGGNRRLNAAQNWSPTYSISSGSSVDYCSRSVSDLDAEEENCEGGVEEEENSVLDDWEAVADALEEDDLHNNNQGHDPASSVVESGILCEVAGSGDSTKPQPVQSTMRAWTPDDTARPQSLPSILKQWSFPSNMERQYNYVLQRCSLSSPSACPICCEDLDPTDTSFIPCSCGFRLCLFCHKRILEADGRCPGCRKQYDASLGCKASEVNNGQVPLVPFRLPRSCSMNARY